MRHKIVNLRHGFAEEMVFLQRKTKRKRDMKHKLDYETPESRAVALAPEESLLQLSMPGYYPPGGDPFNNLI